MFTKKKWFSFLEMLIVVMIVSVLFVAFRWSFQIKNKDILYGQSCIETIYGQVNNFLYAWLSSKWVFSWSSTIFPNEYIINFQPISWLIELKYKTGENTSDILYSSIEITENRNIGYCSSNSYILQLTWENYEIHINKWLQENAALQFFYLSGKNFSGENLTNIWVNSFLQCNNQWTWCKTIARFESDTRTVSIKKQICLSFTGANDCLEWDN